MGGIIRGGLELKKGMVLSGSSPTCFWCCQIWSPGIDVRTATRKPEGKVLAAHAKTNDHKGLIIDTQACYGQLT